MSIEGIILHEDRQQVGRFKSAPRKFEEVEILVRDSRWIVGQFGLKSLSRWRLSRIEKRLKRVYVVKGAL